MIKSKRFQVNILLILMLVFGFYTTSVYGSTENDSYTYFNVYPEQISTLEPGQWTYISISTDGYWERISYASSDEGIAKVYSNGSVEAISGGSKGSADVDIHVYYDGKIMSTWHLTVQNTITLNREEYEVYTGQKSNTYRLEAYSNPSGTVKWSSKNTSVATVNQEGVITPKKPGVTYIQAKANGVTAKCRLRVRKPEFTLDSKAEVYVKDTASLNASIYPTCNIRWKSSNTSIVRVDNTGKITGVKAGTATITATAAGITKKCKVTVKNPTISFYNTELHLYKGSIANLYAQVTPYHMNVKWSSSNEKVAKVDKNGEVKAIGTGTAKVTAVIPGTKAKATCKITVYKNLYKINLTSKTLMVGQKFELRDASSSAKYLYYNIESYNDVISIDSLGNGNCSVEAQKAGTETVVASCTDYVDGHSITWRQKCKVTVIDKGISEQQFSRAVGQKKTLKLIGMGKSSYIKKVVWSSSSRKVAEINSSTGAVTAKGKGETKITATVTFKSGKVKRYSTRMKVSAPTIKKSSISLAVRKTANVGLKGTNAWSSVSYKSSNSSVAVVDGSGNVVAVGKGNATITISVDGKTMRCKVYVSNPQITSYNAILALGKTAKIKFTGVGSKSKLSFKSKDSSVAKVDSKGTIKAVNCGSTYINITVDGLEFAYLVEVAPQRAIDACEMGEYILRNWTYSQDNRMTEGYYDCSGLVFRSYGFDSQLLGGSPTWGPTAANMAKYMEETGKVLSYGVISPDKMRPGDLIFQGETDNGRFLGIYHVDLYYGGGYYAPYNTVMIARPLM